MLPHSIPFEPGRDSEIFALVPSAPTVFALRGSDPDAEPYVSKTANLRRRLIRLLGAGEGLSRKLHLRHRVSTVEYAPTGSDFESGLVLYHTLRREFPRTYADRLKLRPAPLVRLILENAYPRVAVTTRIATLRGQSVYYGPFPSRVAAEKFANDALDFFKIRRCTEELAPDPAHPGCIYSQMKMCLAPCFRGCTDAEYRNEVVRVQDFFDTGGESLSRELTYRRDDASANLEFEAAAALHTQLEKVAPVRSQLPEIVTRIDRLRALIVQPSALAEHVTFFVVEAGTISDPVQFPIQLRSADPSAPPPKAPSAATSMEGRIQQALASLPADTRVRSSQEIVEQLAYLKRWYYRTSKIGEIFFADAKGDLPWRRIVRGVSRVFRGEKAAGDLAETTRDYWINRGKAAELNPDNYNV